jgi:hypothetical protein
MIVNFLFLIDLIASFVVYGCKYISNNKNILFLEIALQIMAIRALFWFFDKDIANTLWAINLLNVICLFRMLRLLYLLTEIK